MVGLILMLCVQMADRTPVQMKLDRVLMDFHLKLFPFTQVMLSIRNSGLPDRIEVICKFFIPLDLYKIFVCGILAGL